jgi:hypothetical protein
VLKTPFGRFTLCLASLATVVVAAAPRAQGAVVTQARLFEGVYVYDGSGYNRSTGFNAPYTAGYVSGFQARGFVIFGVPVLQEPIIDVVLKLQAFGTYAAGGAENQTVSIFDVSPSSFPDLFSGANDAGVFADLGNGAPGAAGAGAGHFYGSHTFPVSTPPTDVLNIHLNSTAFADIVSAQGSFGVGIAIFNDGVNDLGDDNYAFGGSENYVASLVITTGAVVPEASSLVLCGMGVAASVGWAWRRRKHSA